MELHTKRLTIRPWAEKDIADIVEGLNDFEVSKWLALVPHPYTIADAHDWVKHCQALTDGYEWAMDLNGKAIGGMSLKVTGDTGVGGIWLSRKYHGHGYGAEAWAARNKFAFEGLGLASLDSGYFVGNEPSRVLHERAGFRATHVTELYNKAQKKLLPEQRLVLTRAAWGG